MHHHGHDDDPWAEQRARRETWRAERQARREAWRAAWNARREERHARWRVWNDAHGFGIHGGWGQDDWGHAPWGHKDWGQGDKGQPAQAASETDTLKATVAGMQTTIEQLLERVAVLERLATDDEAKLAREIERLRDTDTKT